MKTMVKIENSVSGKSLSMYVDSTSKVNELMLDLIEAGFTVDYEPRYISGNYEGCFPAPVHNPDSDRNYSL